MKPEEKKLLLDFLNEYTAELSKFKWKNTKNTCYWLRFAKENRELIEKRLAFHGLVTYEIHKIKESEDFCLIIQEERLINFYRMKEKSIQEQLQLQKALIQASRDGNVQQITEIIPNLKQLNWRDLENEQDEDNLPGATALHYAAESGQVDALAILIQSKFNIDAYDDSFWTPLFYAVYEGKLEAVASLIQQGADILKKGACSGGQNSIKLEFTVLHYAADFASVYGKDRLKILELLLKAFKEKYVLGQEKPLVDINSLVTASLPNIELTIFDSAFNAHDGIFDKEYNIKVLEMLNEAGFQINLDQIFEKLFSRENREMKLDFEESYWKSVKKLIKNSSSIDIRQPIYTRLNLLEKTEFTRFLLDGNIKISFSDEALALKNRGIINQEVCFFRNFFRERKKDSEAAQYFNLLECLDKKIQDTVPNAAESTDKSTQIFLTGFNIWRKQSFEIRMAIVQKISGSTRVLTEGYVKNNWKMSAL